MSTPAELTDRITAVLNSTCLFADFTSAGAAVTAIKSLSFVEVDRRGISLPKTLLRELFNIPNRTEVIVGGTLPTEQRVEIVEIYDVFKRQGKINAVALPKPAAVDGSRARRAWNERVSSRIGKRVVHGVPRIIFGREYPA